MNIIFEREEMKEDIFNKLKPWNLDNMYLTDDYYKKCNEAELQEAYDYKSMHSLEYYFDQLEKAKKEISGIFTRDEILAVIGRCSGHLCDVVDDKEFLIQSWFNYYNTFVSEEKGEIFLRKLNELTEMQVHALMCICKEIRGEVNVQELFGCIEDNEESVFKLI